MKTKTLSIIDAIKDDNLFKPFFGSLASYKRWLICLKCLFGLPIRTEWGRKLVKECTGRDARTLNPDGYQTALLICGRRSGKSRIAATIAAYSAALAGLESKLSAGETGLISVVSPTRKQGRIVRNYVRSLYDSPILTQEVVKERTLDAFQLRNGNRLEILASDYRSIRGYTQLAVVLEEVAFLGLEDSSKVRTDTQLVTSLLPALATTNGKLIAITSPYGKTGWVYNTYMRHWGSDSPDTLVWRAASRLMNPTLPQSVVDRAMREDLASAKTEYLAEFRDDVCNFIAIELVESLVVRNRKQLLPHPDTKYHAFVDLSGGRNDASALAIAHRDSNGKSVLDFAKDWPSPHKPSEIVCHMVEHLNEFGIRKVEGDNFSAEFACEVFEAKGIRYEKCPKNKSVLYGELLPILSSHQISLLDDPRLVKQLASLERRTVAGGKDKVDHPKGAHDDLANAVAGAAIACRAKKIRIGVAF